MATQRGQAHRRLAEAGRVGILGPALRVLGFGGFWGGFGGFWGVLGGFGGFWGVLGGFGGFWGVWGVLGGLRGLGGLGVRGVGVRVVLVFSPLETHRSTPNPKPCTLLRSETLVGSMGS